MNSFICHICGKQFNIKNSLSRHIKRSHEIKFKCTICVEQFSLKRELQRHINQTHNENNFVCAICNKQFKTRRLIQRHIRIHLEKKFECNQCNKKFRVKWKLLYHLMNNCNKKSEKQKICAVCGKQFKTRESIKQHVQIHLEKKFECNHCGNKFPNKWKLLCHLRNMYSQKYNRSLTLPEKQNSHSLKCGFCNSYFSTRKKIQHHFQIDHKVILSWELLNFNSEKDFKHFKLNYQRKTITQFVIRSSNKMVNKTLKLFKCHRSGLYERKKGAVKFPKMNGLKKIQSYCPAEMRVECFEDGKCVVQFQKIHVGHNINDRSELCHIYLEFDERQEIAAKKQLGVPKNTIHPKGLLADQGIEGSKLPLSTNQDVRKVADSYNIQNDSIFALGEDLLDVDSFVKTYEASILFLKKQFEEDSRFNVLAIDDFAIIIMNKFQEKNLRLYGKNIIAFDKTHGTNKYDFILHTLLVMDLNYEGVPSAFLVSNRNDEIIVNIFLQCIKEQIGVFTTHVIMSDMQPTYHGSWVKIMENEPNFTLWCTWRVREAWRKNYSKIRDEKKRTEVKKTIENFVCELDPSMFQIKLNKFLRSNDVDLTEFVSYFHKHYVDNENSLKWAYCYRKGAGINTNISLESFHQTLKNIHANKKPTEDLIYILNCIKQYLDVEEISKEIESYIKVRTNKLKILRGKHNEARKMRDVANKVHIIDSNSWLVESFEKENTTYFIEKREIKECNQYEDVICNLFCDLCQICFHEYSCSCFDAAIRNNMCKHIHAVGILQTTSKTLITEQLITEQTTSIPNLSNESPHNLQIEELVTFQESEIENINALEKGKQNMRNWFEDMLEKIPNFQVLTEINKKFFKPVIPTINSFNTLTPKTEFKNETSNHNSKSKTYI